MSTLIVFDIDGTLLDSVAAHLSAFRAALRATGLTGGGDAVSGYRHHTDSWIYREIFRGSHRRLPDRAELSTFAKALSGHYDAGMVREIPGAAAFLRELAESPGHTVVFATGGLREVTSAKLDAVAPRGLRDVVVTAGDHTFREHIVAEAVRRAERAAGPFDRVIAVGDGPWDLRAAVAMNMEFIGVGQTSAAFGDWFPPAHVVSSFDQVELDRAYLVVPPAGAVPRAPDADKPFTPNPGACICWT